MSFPLIRGDFYGEKSEIVYLSAQQHLVALKRAAGDLCEHLYKLVLREVLLFLAADIKDDLALS